MMLDLGRRHPLCPNCGYDLVATVAAHKRICPECGAEFELSELRWASRAGDWTPLVGLRVAARTLALRCLIGLVVWCGVSLLVVLLINGVLLINSLPTHRFILFLLAVAAGCLMGVIFSRGLADQAGFDSKLLVVAALIGVTITIVAGQIAVELLTWPPTKGSAAGLLLVIVALITSWAWILHAMAMESF